MMIRVDYNELFALFMAESVILSAIFGAAITWVIYKITNKSKKVKVQVVVKDVSEEAMNAKRDKFIKYVNELEFK